MRALSIIVFAAAIAMPPAPAHAASDPHPPAKPAAPKPADSAKASKPATGHEQSAGRTTAAGHKPTVEPKQAGEHKAAVHKTGEPAAESKPGAALETAAKPAPARAATAAELEALNERIQQRVAEVKKAQKAKAAAASARRPSAPAPPRVRVEWRPSVSWPQELNDAPAAADAGERVALTWNPIEN